MCEWYTKLVMGIKIYDGNVGEYAPEAPLPSQEWYVGTFVPFSTVADDVRVFLPKLPLRRGSIAA